MSNNSLVMKATFEDELRRYLNGGIVNHTMLEILNGLSQIMGKGPAQKRFDEIAAEVKSKLDKKMVLNVSPITEKRKRGRPKKSSVPTSALPLVQIPFNMALTEDSFTFTGPRCPHGTLSSKGKVELIWTTHNWINIVVNDCGTIKTVGISGNCTSFLS